MGEIAGIYLLLAGAALLAGGALRAPAAAAVPVVIGFAIALVSELDSSNPAADWGLYWTASFILYGGLGLLAIPWILLGRWTRRL